MKRRIAMGACALVLAGCVSAYADASAADETKAMHHDAHRGPPIIEVASKASFDQTLDQLKAAIDKRGLKTFAVIDHAAGAASIGETLRPTTLVIFGNPKGGTPLMQSAQSLGIALPLKALVYENASSDVMVAVIDIEHIVEDHGADDQKARAMNIAGALAAIAAEAATE